MTTTDTFAEAGLRPRSARGRSMRIVMGLASFARHKPLGFIGSVLVAIFIVLALFAPIIAPFQPGAIDLKHGLEGPTRLHLLGTDQVGHDVLSRLIYGARLSMTVGFGAVIISSVVATVLGILSAYVGGWVDLSINRLVDAWIAMPDLIILITIMGVTRRTEINPVIAILASLALLRFAPVTRIYRSAVLELRSRPFVESAQAAGAGPMRAMVTHILPNVLPLIIVTSTVALPLAILAEASLSFLGFGPAGQPSWGQMLSVDGRQFFRKQPGLAIYPGLCIGLAVFGFNMFGDALRDILDPRLRGS